MVCSDVRPYCSEQKFSYRIREKHYFAAYSHVITVDICVYREFFIVIKLYFPITGGTFERIIQNNLV
jgi:hypothetical protein